MKRKMSSREDWITSGAEFLVANKKDTDFDGHITIIKIKEVTKPWWVKYHDEEFFIFDVGYCWTQHFPTNMHYALTTVFNENNQVIQWYIDVVKQYGLNEQGIPWYDDLYLDIVLLPSGKVFILDSEELQNALETGEITQFDFNLAWEVADDIKRSIANGIFQLPDLSIKHYKQLIDNK
ncbi:DUF402 domain-containing protein [Paenibacillus radicis (ex Xue et al. 2023)]|uniref:DUF402 domain-containing protein n=1 Tax=Paenibacillus radicis (ex Xue et al. 2023) TaxID=2972489 RepID=A0ABT1YAV0_9BACL|nr:DUF402 domain-containing protein [Paenibacillus radicis (ex Xue et al. 2023)]MCR8629885.1 DUF402 domain-containing protein [Paenibacillus radicis (ex Xue et al. 2023)]